MSNKQIKRLITELLQNFSCWEKPENISRNMQQHSLDTMRNVLTLLEKAKPLNNKRSFHSYHFDYIYQLYQIEFEMKNRCYYNACYKLYSVCHKVPLFEKQILLNTIDVLRKNLSEVKNDVLQQN